MDNVALLKKYTPAVQFSRLLSEMSRKVASVAHRIQFKIEWRNDNPEHFDHNIDLYHKWKKTRSSYPIERGVWSSFAIAQESELGLTLDLCCGDGFYSYYFYSLRSKQVLAIDFEPSAIKQAKKMHNATNINYLVGDIRENIPDGPFNNIIWDAAIEHFTEVEIHSLMGRIKSVLTVDGVVSGYTIVEDHTGEKRLHQHEYEFHNKEDLARFLSPWFKNVTVMVNKYPDRENLYFYASDGNLPFEKENLLNVKKIGEIAVTILPQIPL